MDQEHQSQRKKRHHRDIRGVKPGYAVDLPRGMNKKGLADFYSGIEVIKKGVAYDKRYSAKKKRFNRPVISFIVLSSCISHTTHLSLLINLA